MKPAPETSEPASVQALQERLAEADYFAGTDLATAIFLALRLGKPLLLEGEAGVGKTEVAKALSRLRGVPLLRLQCYEGLDLQSAVYEWDYSRQLLHIRLLEATGEAGADLETAEQGLYQPRFLLRRPLLEALEQARAGTPPVLLIDELDRADEEFEAFLLELLSDFQVSIPELPGGGAIRAETPPLVVLTSNRTREVHDALRRRCLYCWVDYPDAEKELRIVRAKAPGAGEALSRRVVDFVQALRREDLYKRPGVAETLDWALALDALDAHELTPEVVNQTLGALLKYQDDLELIRGDRAAALLESAS